MKKVLLLLLLFRGIAYGQKFEVTTLAGSSKYEFAKFQFYDGNSFTGKVSLAYYPVKRISLGISYDMTTYKELPGLIGGFADYHVQYFLAGINIASQDVSTKSDFAAHPYYTYPNYDMIRYSSPALSMGAHVGLQIPVKKILFLLANITVTSSKLTAHVDQYSQPFGQQIQSVIQDNVITYSWFLGLSYRI